MKKILSLILALSLIFALAACGGNKDTSSDSADTSSETVFQKPESYASVVLVTINPQLRLYLDENDVVLAVEPINDDAKALTKDLKIEGKEFKAVISEVVSAANESGFIKKGATVDFKIEEAITETVDTAEILKDASDSVNEVIIEEKIEVSIKTEDKTHVHKFSEPTCQYPATCSCGEAGAPALGHDYKNGKCTRCGHADPNAPKLSSVKTKNGSWEFDFVAEKTLNQAAFSFNENPVIFGVSLGDDFNTIYAGESPEVLAEIKKDESSVEYKGSWYWVARGSGPKPMSSFAENGATVTVTDDAGNKLILTRTSETSMKVTSSPAKFSSCVGKIPVGTILTFKAN